MMDDIRADGKTEPGPALSALGGEEGIEDPARQLVRDSGAVVLFAQQHAVPRAAGLDQNRAPPTFFDGLTCVQQQVQHHLDQATAARRQSIAGPEVEFDARGMPNLMTHQVAGSLYDFVDIHELDVVLVDSCKATQALDDESNPLNPFQGV